MAGNPFTILGLASTASTEQIKAAFRKLALEYHPDRHVSSSESVRTAAANKFQAVTEAYDTLSNERKRSTYQAATRVSSAATAYEARYGPQHTGASDYARSYYHHDYSADQRVRLTTWQAFTRAAGARRLEAGLFFMFASVLVIGVGSVDNLWAYHNRGKRFSDMYESTPAGLAAFHAGVNMSRRPQSSRPGHSPLAAAEQEGARGPASRSGITGGSHNAPAQATSSRAAGAGVRNARASRGHATAAGGPSEAEAAKMSLEQLKQQEDTTKAATTANGVAQKVTGLARAGGIKDRTSGTSEAEARLNGTGSSSSSGCDVDRAAIIPARNRAGWLGAHFWRVMPAPTAPAVTD